MLGLVPPVSLLDPGQNPISAPQVLVLPVLTLVMFIAAAGIRMVRAGIVRTLNEEYVSVARLNGYSDHQILWRFVIRNSLAPSFQVFAEMLRYLFGGIIIVESIFDYPGLGSELVNAVSTRDAPKVAAIAMIIAIAYAVINLLADLLVFLSVPKLRMGNRQ
jgi:peptide/nickel transport system permease protein